MSAGDQRPHFFRSFFLQMQEARDHIGDLHAGVIDVVLNLHLFARGAKHADERVAEDRVAQMADVRGLVGIDIGVLDDDLFRARIAGRRNASFEQPGPIISAVEPDIQIPIARDFDAGDAFDPAAGS